MTHEPTLFMIPNLLGGDSISSVLPASIADIVGNLTFFLAEHEKSARHLIKLLSPNRVIRELSIERLDLNTSFSDIARLMKPLNEGHSIGVISEAGCPA